MRSFHLLAASCALALLFHAAPAGADNWQANIYEPFAPKHLVGVDKKQRLFKFFEKKSPFKLRYTYPCVTGQLPGDKQQINDLRTPEGIYFVEYKIAHGLDFREYGGIAYTLNYPNPVDRLRGKTGHGIWIHSKGFGLTPTRGCVAIDLNNIAEVGPLLLPGTPVVLAEELNNTVSKNNPTLEKLRSLMDDWSNAWASRSNRLFDFYDPVSYSRATENFDLFRKNKERLFKILSFIKIYNREIHALEGPGYWVTWSEQLYTASNLSTEGIRRLYWQKDDNGAFRIVGMEWTPRDVGMAAAFKEGKLVAEATPASLADAASEAPRAPRLDMPEQENDNQVISTTEEPAPKDKSPRASLLALAEAIFNNSEPLFPGRKSVPANPDEIIWGHGAPMNESAASSNAPEPAVQPEPTPALTLPAAPKTTPDKTLLNERLRTEIDNLAQTWREYLQDRNNDLEKLYDSKLYNRMPARTGIPRGESLNRTLQTIRRDFRQPWLAILNRAPKITGTAENPKSEMDMMIATPQGIRQGIQTLWWNKDDKNQYRIVASSFKPENLGLDAAYLDQISAPIASMLEEWRAAWQAGDVEKYGSYYAKTAIQQGRVGAENIKRQKQALWSRVKPVAVQLAGLRIHLDGSGARADMTQFYTNSAGHSDKGTKTLSLSYDGEKWRIQKEDWEALPPNS